MAKKKKRGTKPAVAQSLDEMNMCKLTKEGLMEEIDKRANDPTSVCNRCRAKANAARDLCQPRMLV